MRNFHKKQENYQRVKKYKPVEITKKGYGR